MAGLGSSPAAGPWLIAADERTKHENTFQSLKPSCGFLSGEQAKQFFLKSNLPPMVLGQIWSLSDLDRDGKMTMQEFTIAMHLIQIRLKGIEIPSSLPNTLKMTSLPSTFNRNQPTKAASPNYSPTGQSNLSNGFKMSGTMTLPKPSGISWSGQGTNPSALDMSGTMPKSSGISWSGVSQQASSSQGGGFGNTSGLGSLSASFNVGMGTTTTNMGVPNGPGIMAIGVQGGDVRRTQSLNAAGFGATASTMTAVSSVARLKYNQMFKANDYKQTGFLSGDQVRSMLIQSGLPQTSLVQIWKLSDVDKDGQLNLDEFILAMHFVDMSKLGHPLPLAVPTELLTPAMQLVARPHSDSVGSMDGRDRAGSNVSVDGRSRSGSIADDKRNIFCFEDKRKQNFEKGRLELEKRRQDLQEKLKREKDDRETKERLEEERRQRAKMEAEQRRQAELNKQRQQQLEMEREQEVLRKQMIQQRLAAQIEAERKRQHEWQQRKKEELLNQKGLEQDIVNNLKLRLKKLEEELATVVGKKTSAQQSYEMKQQACQETKQALNTVLQNADRRVADISRVQCDIKEYQQRMTVLSNERERVSLEMNKRDTSTLAVTHGNAMASLDDTKGGMRRLKATQTSMEASLEERLKELDALNNQLRESKAAIQQITADNTHLQQTTESKQREYMLWKQRKEEEDRAKKEMEARRRRAEEETRQQKEKEQEAMRQEQERQHKEQELRRRMQEARDVEARRKEDRLLSNDKIVQQQQTLDVSTRRQLPIDVSTRRQLPICRVEPEGGGDDIKSKLKQAEQKIAGQTQNSHLPFNEPTAIPRPRPRPVKKSLEYYRVVYMFDPRNPDELLIDENDIVTVDPEQTKAPPGWMRGKCKDKSGLFPANYVEKITEEEAKREQTSNSSPELAPQPEVSVKSLVAALSQQLAGGGNLSGGNIATVSSGGIATQAQVTEGPSSGGGTPAPQGLTAVALYAYRAKKEDMLNFNKNDMITIKEQQDIWWSGELNGKVGWFPKSYVKLVSSAVKTTGSSSNAETTVESPSLQTTPVAPQATQNDLPVLFDCVALYAYNGEEGDLNFVEGDVIGITKNEGEWWQGKLRGNTGLFPANYVKKKETEVPVAAPRTKPEIATVLSPYTAIAADQLSLAPGQLIRVTRKDPSGWWEGELQARGKRRQSGMFPANHVKVLAKGAAPDQPITPTTEGGSIYEVPSSLVTATQGKLEQVLAMFPYTAQKGDELTFYKGSVINVMSKEGDWWKGELNGLVGVFPSNYVQALGDLPASARQWTGSFDAKILASMSDTERMRQNAIYELINTEQTYMDQLSLTLEVFYNPLAESGLLTNDELNTIFVNWKELIHCNMKLLKAFLVRKKMRNNGMIVMIADLMCEQLTHLSPYVRFCSRQLKACQLIQLKIETNPEFKQLEKKCCADSRASGLPLSSYLLKPLQRICKYPLLIREILKYTAENHPDRGNLETALEKAEELCNQVNEGVRSQENSDQLEWLQQHVKREGLGEQLIFNSATNCLGQRKLLHYGTLFKVKSGKELKAFLFNDFLLLTRPQTSIVGSKKSALFDANDTSLQYTIYRKPIFLNEIVVKRPADMNSEEPVFSVSHIDRVYTFRGESKGDRNRWIDKLEKAAEHYIETERFMRQKAHRTRSIRTPGVGKLVVTIVEGVDIKASDPNGMSDPYCEVSMGSQEHKTKVCPQTLTPKWNSTMTFTVKDLEQDVLCITVWDRDYFSPNDFLGRGEVTLASLRKKGKGPWCERLLLHEVTTGEVLVKIELQ